MEIWESIERQEEMIPIHADPEIVHRQQRIMRNPLATLQHTLVNEIKLIWKLAVTPASIHDSRINLSIPGIICYRNKGHFGFECKGRNGTMDHSVRCHPLPIKNIRRKLRISRIRSIVKHPNAFFEGIFRFGHVMVTTVQEVKVKTYLTAVNAGQDFLTRQRKLRRFIIKLSEKHGEKLHASRLFK